MSSVPAEKPPADKGVAAFECYLQRDCGLAVSTMRYYRSLSRQFLVDRFGTRPVDFAALRYSDAIQFVQRHGAAHVKALGITALRASFAMPDIMGASPHG